MKRQLVDKIRRRTARLVVIGLGHVGLPTATIFAGAGFQTVGVDAKREIIEVVMSGKSCTREPGLDKLVRKAIESRKLKAMMNTVRAIKEADIVIICVQTPITDDRGPNQTYLQQACEVTGQGLSKGMLVAIGSTVPPGTTNDFVVNILERESGLKCGKDFWLVHSPERMAIGKAVKDFVGNVRIVGGYDPESAEIAVELFKIVTKGEILTTDCTSAEIAKLAENTFRDVNIAFANEVALICELLGADVMDVAKLANTHPRVNIHSPGCGVGGPCLTKDPYLLIHSVKEKGFKPKIIESSRELNEYMTKHTVELLSNALKKVGKDVKTSKIAVLGVAYKGDVDDARNSPAKRIVKKLIRLGAEVVVYDPYCRESFGAREANDAFEAVKGADCLVLATSHKVFEELELERIRRLMNKDPVIVDGRRIVNPQEAYNKGFIYVGIGYSVRCP